MCFARKFYVVCVFFSKFLFLLCSKKIRDKHTQYKNSLIIRDDALYDVKCKQQQHVHHYFSVFIAYHNRGHISLCCHYSSFFTRSCFVLLSFYCKFRANTEYSLRFLNISSFLPEVMKQFMLCSFFQMSSILLTFASFDTTRLDSQLSYTRKTLCSIRRWEISVRSNQWGSYGLFNVFFVGFRYRKKENKNE